LTSLPEGDARSPGRPCDPDVGLDLGVGLLGHALALRAGASDEELVRERVLEPLGMTATGIALTPAMKRHFSLVHGERGEVVPAWDIRTLEGAWGA